MDKINFDEKFSNCTQLCKPHESNKILWTIKQNLKDKNYINSIKKKSVQFKKFLSHILAKILHFYPDSIMRKFSDSHNRSIVFNYLRK